MTFKIIRITRVWAMPSMWTFTIKPIHYLIDKYLVKDGDICDPFAGKSKLANHMNDILVTGIDALTYLKKIKKNKMDMVFYDPPYSLRQAKKYGVDFKSKKYWSECKKELSRILKPGGIAICCGWNSGGLGKSNKLEMIELLLVAHGGNRNDTIVTVERKQ